MVIQLLEEEQGEKDEHVTGLINKSPVNYVQHISYISKHHDAITKSFMSKKNCHKSLGVPKVQLDHPTEFLKKNSRKQVKKIISMTSDVNHNHYNRPNYQYKLPISKPKELNKKAHESSRDFTKQNIDNVQNFKPSNQKMFYMVDDRRGNSFPLLPRYSFSNHSKNLEKKNRQVIKKTIETEILLSVNKIQKNNHPTMYSCISDEERAKLLEGMKKKRDQLMEQFQCLPFLTDTLPKVKKKCQMENNLKKLDKDIQVIERYSKIYIYNDNDQKNENKSD